MNEELPEELQINADRIQKVDAKNIDPEGYYVFGFPGAPISISQGKEIIEYFHTAGRHQLVISNVKGVLIQPLDTNVTKHMVWF